MPQEVGGQVEPSARLMSRAAFARWVDLTIDPPPIETRWWFGLRIATRSIPLIASLIPISARLESPFAFWTLLGLLVAATTAQGGWFTLRGRSRIAKGFDRAFNIYLGLVIAMSLTYMVIIVDQRGSAVWSGRTMLVMVLLYLFTWLAEKMQVRDTGKPVRPGSVPVGKPKESTTAEVDYEPRLRDLVVLILVLGLAAIRRARSGN